VIGRTIAHYEILDKIGEGGMGVVYSARDTRLGRDVAIKVLPEELARDHERMARFEREAHVLAQLNHPNISSIYGLEESDGQYALVMELVDGPTLADRLAARPIPVEDVLPMARQIAEALAAAHEKGIIHRDLKPANIKVNDEGNVKVLDFGLAKALDEESVARQPEDSPTLTIAATQAGIILGTAAYMSPEQARGRPVDKRADIWAFGVVLYEMLTGRQLFGGETVSDSLAGVLKTEIDLEALPAETPAPIRRLLRHCLERDRKHRLHDVADAVLEIDEVAGGEPDAVVVESQSGGRLHRMGLVGAIIALAVALIAVLAMWPRGTAPGLPLRKTLLSAGNAQYPAISPDGRHVAYVQGADTSLWVHDFDRIEPRTIQDTEGATYPFWSPDSRFIGFSQGDKLKRVPLSGGVASTIGVMEVRTGFGGAWSDDGDLIAFAASAGLYTVASRGGEPTLVRSAELGIITTPSFLPSSDRSRRVLYAGGTMADREIILLDLETDQSESVIEGTRPVYSPTGHILYQKSHAATEIWALPYSTELLKPTGEAFPVTEGASRPSVARDGTLVHLIGVGIVRRQLAWHGRSGKQIDTVDLPQDWPGNPSLSPDGSFLAFHQRDRGTGTLDVYIRSTAESVQSGSTRLTLGANSNSVPVWSADGKHVAFASNRRGPLDVFIKSADGATEAELVLGTEETDLPQSWAPGGRRLYCTRVFNVLAGPTELVHLDRKPDGSWSDPFTILRDPGLMAKVEVSPNNRYLAFASDRSGRSEVYVASLPDGEGLWQVSTSGGAHPCWSKDGTELFYVRDGMLLAVPVSISQAFSAGVAEPLFANSILQTAFPVYRNYDVAADARRFVVVDPVVESSDGIRVIQNWYEEFRDGVEEK
jgi:eukaryotic-like serine/threonine-protein kinase